MRRIIKPEKSSWTAICQRPVLKQDKLLTLVRQVFEDIKSEGDKALLDYIEKFDKVSLSDIRVSGKELENAELKLSGNLKNAIKLAKNNIEIFHCSQMDEKLPVETTEGVVCWQEIRPIQKVGLYVPGGTAPLFSTVLMLAVPAQIAGCEDIVLCTPPDKNGEIHPAILYAAKLCGVKKIFKVGGIQAIASMTYGTETISSVYKLFGPGNQYVTAAKQYAQTLGTAIDMPAGPSELLVLADISAKPSYIASDLLSQAEHGEDSQVVFITDTLDLIIEVERELEKQVQMLPREEIARRALKNSKLILMSDKQEMIEFINLYAPEHFILVVSNEEYFLQNIQNAGSVFIGNYTPESAGDYASGTNHTLPTGGFARVYSGLNMDAFTKKITFQKISPEGILKIGKSIELMAEEEGLIGHRNAVSIRLNDLLKKSSK